MSAHAILASRVDTLQDHQQTRLVVSIQFVLEVEELLPYSNSLFLWKLLSLPVAMCHSTLTHFLSYREGREIAARVLDEGMGVFARKGLGLKKLPTMDPQDLHVITDRDRSDVQLEPDTEVGPRAASRVLQGSCRPIQGNWLKRRKNDADEFRPAGSGGGPIDPFGKDR